MKKILLFCLVIISFVSCKNLEKVQISGKAQGTFYNITYFDYSGRNFQVQVDSILDKFNTSVSIYDSASIVSRINRNEENVILDKWFTENYQISKEVNNTTNGAFDITVGPLVKRWGFYFKTTQEIDSMKVNKIEIDSILTFVGMKQIDMVNGTIIKKDPRILIDFNAIAQGYSVEVIGDFLESQGITSYLIDIGGEVLAKGTKPKDEWWLVGIDKPTDDGNLQHDLEAKVKIKDQAIATSGNYRKFYMKDGVKYSHTIDPKTGYPAQHSLLSVSVLTDNCGYADAYATAFMVMGLEKTIEFVKNHPELEVYLIYDEKGQMKTYASKGFKPQIVEEN